VDGEIEFEIQCELTFCRLAGLPKSKTVLFFTSANEFGLERVKESGVVSRSLLETGYLKFIKQ
jgi:hypothetical protein